MNNAGVGSIKNNNMPMNNFDQQEPSYNTYGLSPSFLASLRIQGPLHNKVFVANVSIFEPNLQFYRIRIFSLNRNYLFIRDHL